jgi:hypothetical protein
MTLKVGSRFQFSPPDVWAESKEGNRLVFRGSAGEELIVSSAILEGDPSLPAFADAEQRLLSNAFNAVEKTLANSELRTIKPLSETPPLCSLPCWFAISQSIDLAVFLYQAVVKCQGAVMLVTLETPTDPATMRVFAAFLAGIEPLGTVHA